MDQYYILRYMPSPVRGEIINIGIIGLFERQAIIIPLSFEEIIKRTYALSPSVNPHNAVSLIHELILNKDNINVIRQLLEAFDSHFRIESRRMSKNIDAFDSLSQAFQELVK